MALPVATHAPVATEAAISTTRARGSGRQVPDPGPEGAPAVRGTVADQHGPATLFVVDTRTVLDHVVQHRPAVHVRGQQRQCGGPADEPGEPDTPRWQLLSQHRA